MGDVKVLKNDANDLVPGTFVYTKLMLRGKVLVTEAIVVKPGSCLTVVACPARCALAPSGDWCENAEAGEWQILHCACAEGDISCPVVFYSLSTTSLSLTALNGAITFAHNNGQQLLPLTESLVELFHIQAQGDSLYALSPLNLDLASAQCYNNVVLGEGSSPLLFNSIIVVPDFLSKDECYVLIDAADRAARGGSTAGNFYSYQAGLHRLPVRKLDLEAQMLSSTIVFDRLLQYFEDALPEVAEDLFGQRSKLKTMKCCFSPGEPAVNRYMVGGGIAPHTDKQSLTLNVLLSDLGAFSGGGTAFWPQDLQASCLEDALLDDAIVLRPHQGTAILFNGDVTHAGRPVSSGVRHTYVASFNLFNLEDH